MKKSESIQNETLSSVQSHASKSMERIKLLPRQAFYQNYVYTNKPVIITNATDEWRANSLWTLEWFKNNHGQVNFQAVLPQIDKYSREKQKKSMNIDEYIDLILSDSPEEKPYLGIVELHKLIPSLLEHFRFPEYQWLNSLTHYCFWIGRNRVTPLHCDYTCNLLTQVVGRKKIQLYSPNSPISIFKLEEKILFCHNKYDVDAYKSEIGNLSIEPDYDFTLNSGEMLFIPSGWWHRISSYEPSIAVNMFWFTPSTLLQRLQWQIGNYLGRILKSNVANK